MVTRLESIDLEKIERDVYREYCQDGLADLLIGAFLLFIGLFLPTGSVAPFIVLPILFFAPALQALKKRLVYPRTGYVELRAGDPQPLPYFILGALILGLVVFIILLLSMGILAKPAQWYRWLPIMFGIWLAGIFTGLALRIRLARYAVVAGVALIGGPVFALLPLPGKLGNLGLLFATVGGVLLACGALALALFLRRHPLPAEEVADGQA
jgi:hypothetical protein